MRRAGLLIALVLAAMVSGRDQGEAHGRAAHTLDGAWTVVSAEREGQPADELRGRILTFTRDTFAIRDARGRLVHRGTYKVDAAKKPAHIDFRHREGALSGQTWLGVYVLDGDTLTIADNAVDPAKPRPAGLATAPGSGAVRLAFKRTAS